VHSAQSASLTIIADIRLDGDQINTSPRECLGAKNPREIASVIREPIDIDGKGAR
jgi:hypothetical protein